LFAAVREAFINDYFYKEAQNKTIQNFWLYEVNICDRCSSYDKAAEITDVPNSDIAKAATTGYGCKNSVFLLVYLCA
jgi:hypothetical protein